MAKVLRHRRYVKTCSDNNNNKFWYITEYDDGSILVEYGRIGEKGSSKLHEPGKKNFDSLCRSKERGKTDEPPYRQLNVIEAPVESGKPAVAVKKGDLEDVAAKEIAGGNPKVEKLIKYLAQQNVHNILTSTTMTYDDATGLFSTPCGVVTEDNITSARDQLAKMSKFIKKADWCKDYVKLLEDYLMLIPQKVKNMRNVEDVIPDAESIDKQNSLLDSLQASLDSLKKDPVKKVTTEEKVFSVSLIEISDSKTFDIINRMYNGSINRSHSCSHLKLADIYGVQISTMKDRFDKHGKPIGNVKQLWHGTRVANVLSILHKGLIIPPSSASHCTGRMFGDGLYFSDQSTKSLNYSYGYWGGGSRDNHCFMFVADVAMGKPYVPSGSYGSFPMHGYDSTFAMASRSGVQNNEMIIYRTNQCNLTYLCKFSN
jgi:poly [ADP-ribose] polymerase 2/3/4